MEQSPQPTLEQEIVQLYEMEGPGMLRYAAPLAGNLEGAKDALQEAFFRFFLARSAGQPIQSPKARLFRVVRNYLLDQKRSPLRHEVGIESALELPGRSDEPGTGFTSSGLLQRAAEIGLSARELECVRLRTEGLRYEEIAGVLGLRSGTVGALLARAHGKLRQNADEAVREKTGLAVPVVAEKGYAS
jgi:RNA polymerase sigma-70 factor (ECF subfamily)